MTTTTPRPELRPVLLDGKPYYASPGATKQGDPLPMKQCSACLTNVVWVQAKSGKWYLANCYTNRSHSGHFYVKADPHYITCQKIQEQRAADEKAEQDKARENALWVQATEELMALSVRWREQYGPEYDTQSAEFRGEWNAILAKYGFSKYEI